VDNVVHRLSEELAALIEDESTDLHGLRRAAEQVCEDEKALRRALEGLAFDNALAEAVAADSYWHSNGFAKLNLVRHAEPTFRLRLHVWPTGGESGPAFQHTNIHTHRWEFASLVLAGGVHIEEFAETDDYADATSLVCDRYRYLTPGGSVFGHLRPEGTAVLTSLGYKVHRAGAVHDCDIERLHIVAPLDGEFTATLVVQGPAALETALVYQRRGREPAVDTGLPLTADEVRSLAVQTLDHMAARPEGSGDLLAV
jgi:hypothetical protein